MVMACAASRSSSQDILMPPEERQGWDICALCVFVLRGHSQAPMMRRMRTEARKGEKASARTRGVRSPTTQSAPNIKTSPCRRAVDGSSKARSRASLIYHGIDVKKGSRSARKRTGMQNQAHMSTTTTGEIMDVVVHTASCNMWTTGIHVIRSGAWTWCGRLRERSPAPGVWLDDWCWHVQRG